MCTPDHFYVAEVVENGPAIFLYFAVLGVTAMTVKWGKNKRTIVSYFLLLLL